MYTARIGKIIFERWQERTKNTDKTVKEYFDEQFFPLFFDNERYLMLANNSKFDQAYKQKKKKPLTTKVRQEALVNFHGAIEDLNGFEGHLYMGGYTRQNEDATSSMITQIDIEFKKDDVYFSWLGMAASIGIRGGVSLLTENTTVLDQIVEGWGYYRKYMNGQTELKPHQIDTWNGCWLYHRNDRSAFNAADPLAGFPFAGAYSFKNGVGVLNTIDWVKIIFVLTNLLPQENRLPVYVYSFGQTNTTIGFIPILLEDVRTLNRIYQKLTDNTKREIKEKKAALDRIYNTEFGFYSACRIGGIGLRALEPKDLKKFMPAAGDKRKKFKPGDARFATDFLTYQTWIIAMLKNENLLEYADRLTEELNKIGSGPRGKAGLQNAVQKVIDSKNLGSFIDAITELMQTEGYSSQEVDKNVFDETVTQVSKMPTANIPLLLTFIRFKYAFKNA